MQLRAFTQKSASAAILLLVVILITTAIRSRINLFDIEVANSIFPERIISLTAAMVLLLFGGIVEGKIFPRSGLNKS